MYSLIDAYPRSLRGITRPLKFSIRAHSSRSGNRHLVTTLETEARQNNAQILVYRELLKTTGMFMTDSL